MENFTEIFAIRKYWATLDDPFPNDLPAQSVYEKVTKGDDLDTGSRTMEIFYHEDDAREAFDAYKIAANYHDVWSGDYHRRLYKVTVVTLERVVYEDEDSEMPDLIETLEWEAKPIQDNNSE